ncbi:MAG: oligosaccharide flippase family protein [Bacteroidaceae bacterium]|nr:oligosaccharide flippase family protein [Bacteroidaceae bacterium]
MKSDLDNTLSKNILKLISGEGIGRAIGFMTAPFITRLYTPSDFGILAVFASLCVLCYPFCTLKYTLAIPLHSNEKIGINSLAACLLILVINTVIIGITLVFFHSPVLSFFSSENIDAFWYFIPLAFLLNGTAEVLSYYSTRYRDFSTIAKVTVVQKIIGASTNIVLGLFRFNVIGLLIGNILAESGGLSLYIRTYWKRLKEGSRNVTWKKICFVLKRYMDFPLYRIPSQILLKASGSLPILYFAWHSGTDTTGQISLAITMLSAPVAVVCRSVGKAFYGEIASLGKKSGKEISTLTVRIMTRLFAVSIIPFTLIICFGPWIFRTFFGAEWSQSGTFARYLCFYLIFRFVYSPISDGIFNVFEQQKLVFRLEVSRMAIVASSIFISYIYDFSVANTIIAYSLALTVQYILSIILVFHILRRTL